MFSFCLCSLINHKTRKLTAKLKVIMRRKLSQPLTHALIIVGYLSCSDTAWAFNSRRMEHAFFLMTLIVIFVVSLIAILIALGALKYLEKRGQAFKHQARIVRALKLAPILIGAVELIFAYMGAEFWRQF